VPALVTRHRLAALIACSFIGSSALAGAQTPRIESARPPILRGLDHFFVTSPNPEPLYHFFRDTLGLPEVYPFRDYGDFASGVVSMGNVLFEVVTWKAPPGETLPVELKGLAFEPTGNVSETLRLFKEYGLPDQKPDSVMMTDSAGVKRVVYVNIGLDGPGGLPPAMGAIFINDNLGSARAVMRRKTGSEELLRRNGGRLGLVSVRELMIGSQDTAATLAKWRKTFGKAKLERGGVITWEIGPVMRFVTAPADALLETVLAVRSIDDARRFLESKGIAKLEGGHLYVAPAAVGGLRIRLVE
jgi:hypothetical protein